MKKYINVILIAMFLGLFGVTTHYKKQNYKLQTKVEVLLNNEYAYQQDILGYQDSLFKERGVYKLSLKELSNSKDSSIIELEKIRKENKIKDKEIQEMSHFIAGFKKDTTINITNIINDSCEFDLNIKYNEETKFNISNKKINGQDSLTHSASISSSFNAYIYETKVWKEPKFLNRVIKFKWGKYTIDKSKLVPSNEEIKIKDFKVVKVK